MRILACGSLTWTDWATVRQALTDLEAEADDRGESITLVHGAARGADTMAATFARRRWWQVEAHPADWARWPGRAGHIRNQEMVNLGADVCVAFWKGRSGGTASTIAKARAAGIRTVVYEQDEAGTLRVTVYDEE